MSPSVIKLCFALPAPCHTQSLEASSEKLLKMLNNQIQMESEKKNIPRCQATTCAPIMRSIGTLLPCGWYVRFSLPKNLFNSRTVRGSSIESITLKYLKKLGVPLLPAKRQVSDDFDPEKKGFSKERYELRLSRKSRIAFVTIGVGCSCVVRRYLTHFQLTKFVTSC